MISHKHTHAAKSGIKTLSTVTTIVALFVDILSAFLRIPAGVKWAISAGIGAIAGCVSGCMTYKEDERKESQSKSQSSSSEKDKDRSPSDKTTTSMILSSIDAKPGNDTPSPVKNTPVAAIKIILDKDEKSAGVTNDRFFHHKNVQLANLKTSDAKHSNVRAMRH